MNQLKVILLLVTLFLQNVSGQGLDNCQNGKSELQLGGESNFELNYFCFILCSVSRNSQILQWNQTLVKPMHITAENEENTSLRTFPSILFFLYYLHTFVNCLSNDINFPGNRHKYNAVSFGAQFLIFSFRSVSSLKPNFFTEYFTKCSPLLSLKNRNGNFLIWKNTFVYS